MAKQILNEVISDDPFHLITSPDELQHVTHVITPLDLYFAEQKAFDGFSGHLGVRMGTDQDLSVFLPVMAKFELIDIHYQHFTDGRGHSLARLLREAYHFQGVLRASGDVFKDTVFYLKRCGFNSFLVKESETLEHALQGFKVFSESYQGAVDEIPLFRRRLQTA
ncbi:MAG: hypothetical protein B7Z60_00645 [Ferrovum sp. 37-45-19]|jgi:uncharacterized protein (DUF934 family)|uniref:DUF934 domain-containing protein n=1 Tax=Ferrovum sp. JA12 TaxID=1356299 RepID=UPI000703ADC0|nr:DUF934 domain-containing protein [Ferrovum sp. JA12]OYV79866.1 MAG: hypothetical protein B7Z65_03935 [Ferrovum sp. 21-44-67]OYV95490.1 MAG: hypothetical protein B7Z60_00645 [Ferrovum sp. 37-45-19]OZB31535.1 MAG: hypothetical protein B7X47_09835 [Ferrovum sp. 34-44-207]HQT81286.1 DUF934 domain-containing protein [Ferrovaceae bacterium]KRH78174.1 hypothetical protein FERRO_11540 [Ferrovum sp. JA12]